MNVDDIQNNSFKLKYRLFQMLFTKTKLRNMKCVKQTATRPRASHEPMAHMGFHNCAKIPNLETNFSAPLNKTETMTYKGQRHKHSAGCSPCIVSCDAV